MRDMICDSGVEWYRAVVRRFGCESLLFSIRSTVLWPFLFSELLHACPQETVLLRMQFPQCVLDKSSRSPFKYVLNLFIFKYLSISIKEDVFLLVMMLFFCRMCFCIILQLSSSYCFSC